MEATPLLAHPSVDTPSGGLSLPFATLCMIDLFGVFPIVALPRAVIDCGWLGIPLALTVFGIQVYTALLLGRCWVIAEKINPTIIRKSRSPYAALADMAFGRSTSTFVSVLQDVTMFGGGIPNLLLASQNIQLFGLKMSGYSFNLSFCYWMLILGAVLCPMMWFGSPKDMKWLCVTSVITVCVVAVLTWSCLVEDKSNPVTVINPAPSWEAIAIAYGILAFQFDLHPVVLTIQVDMKERSKLGHAILGGFLFTGTLFLITTIIAMVRYGQAIQFNVLQALPGSFPLYIDLLLITIQIILSMVVAGSALFQDIEDYLGIPRDFNWKRCLLRCGVVVASVLIGEMVPRFDLVMGLIGGTLTGPLMFILPPLIYARLRFLMNTRPAESSVDQNPGTDSQRDADSTGNFVTKIWRWVVSTLKGLMSVDYPLTAGAQSSGEKWFLTVVVVLGILATMAATFYNVRDTIRYAYFVPPCFTW